MSKYKFFVLFLIMQNIASFSQQNYYIQNGKRSVGIHLIDGSSIKNSTICQTQNKIGIQSFSPYEIEEYGFKDGRVYIAKDVIIDGIKKRVFLECLVSGKTTLYYFKSEDLKTFFLEKDSTLFVEIPKHDIKGEVIFKDQLLKYASNCNSSNLIIKKSKYNKLYLSEVVKMENNCTKNFPSFYQSVSLNPIGIVISFTNEDYLNFSLTYEKKVERKVFFVINLEAKNLSTQVVETVPSLSEAMISYIENDYDMLEEKKLTFNGYGFSTELKFYLKNPSKGLFISPYIRLMKSYEKFYIGEDLESKDRGLYWGAGGKFGFRLGKKLFIEPTVSLGVGKIEGIVFTNNYDRLIEDPNKKIFKNEIIIKTGWQF